jgi:hypothetical protein
MVRRPCCSRVSAPLALLALVPLLLGGCRADAEQCRDLARHIVELADAEGQGATAGTAVALENDCKQLRPTKRLVRCMAKAQSLAEVDAC